MTSTGTSTSTSNAPTTIVRIRREYGQIIQDCDVYIGRRIFRGGWNLPESKWHNPFHRRGTSIEAHQQAFEAYDNYIRNLRPDLLRSLEELRGKRLGCWCKNSDSNNPQEQAIRCHGEVLLQLLREKDEGTLHIPSEPSR